MNREAHIDGDARSAADASASTSLATSHIWNNGGGSRRIGAILASHGKLDEYGIERILEHHAKSSLRFGESALELKLITENDLQVALAEQFDFPCVLPQDPRFHRSLLAATRPFGKTAESLRALRAELMMRWLDHEQGARTIAVVGNDRGEGRSHIAANLAITFAQLGARTVLVDADMRNPRQHELFALDNRSGVSAILAGRGEADAIQRVPPFDSLSIITAGAEPPNPQELLARPMFGDLMAELSKSYYVVIVDTPAGAISADARLICRGTGAALMVLRKNSSRAGAARRFAESISSTHTTLLGTVLNDF